MNNLNPNWDDAEIDLALLCGGNVDTPLLIKVFDYEKDGKVSVDNHKFESIYPHVDKSIIFCLTFNISMSPWDSSKHQSLV